MKYLPVVSAIVLGCSPLSSVAQQSPSATNAGTTLPETAVIGSEAHPARVSGGLMANNILKKTALKFPSEAAKQGLYGVVVMKATVDPQGKVLKLEAVSGPTELRDAALDCVRKWIYKPFVLNGQPVFVETTISVLFAQRS